MEKLTASQEQAIAARGNVLVMAGAGTGKTRTLVERCLALIAGEKVSLDEILVVTFTEAAATEMRQRLRGALEDRSRHDPDPHFVEQLALFDAAHIGTLHSFCFQLIRDHFHELGLDPQVSILDEGEARLLARETIDEQFAGHYGNENEFSAAVIELVRIYGNGDDGRIQNLVLRLYDYLQTRADSERRLAAQLEMFSVADPGQWRRWFDAAVADWGREWMPWLETLRGDNVKAAECLEILKRSASAASLEKILAADDKENYPAKKFTSLRKPLKAFFEEATFLGSLVGEGENDPLAEDWNWVRGHMRTLLLLVQEFTGRFATRKRDDGVLDFHDLEQFALKLLWDVAADRPREIAQRWREKLRFVFVDEYQDINAAQDRIIHAVSREGPGANRFLVGDVKQSIYRFRLADPAIFRRYAEEWTGTPGRTIALSENFRSDGSLLEFVNALFTPLMRAEVGGVDYDASARLVAGRERREPGEPRVELCLRIKGADSGANEEGDVDKLADLEESEKEARMLALHLRRLKEDGRRIMDDGALRPVGWSDMAVLLRSPAGKAEIFAKQFEQAGVPLTVQRGGFYDSSEVADLLCLLQLLDNPLQDVPLIAVLRSPLVGLTLDELAEVRMSGGGHFWFALGRSRGPGADKVARFLEQFGRWRTVARRGSLSHCLEEILDETRYADWLKTQSRGRQRAANVERFVHLAEKFDQFHRQGLFRFLKFIEAQREAEAEPELAPSGGENAVQLLSIHRSKGLEFPVVAVPDLGKAFNLQDLSAEIIFDETFGLCPRVKPPAAIGRYSSLPHWLAKKHQRRELAGEELRLLYVALTRARELLVLTGNISGADWQARWSEARPILSRTVAAAKSYADWIGLWFAQQPDCIGKTAGQTPLLRWRIIDDAELREVRPQATLETVSPGKNAAINDAAAKRLRETLAWQYPFEPATGRSAKSSVTALRREANEESEASPVFRFPSRRSVRTALDAADVGLAHHKFLQHFRFDDDLDPKGLKTETARLIKENYLSEEEGKALDLSKLAAFWDSEIGKKIRSQASAVHRELAFTAKFRPAEIDGIVGRESVPGLEHEFIVVQGVADLVVLLAEEIWLVDFKTDDVAARDLPEKVKLYRPQLRLYARALEKVYGRPVTNCWLHFLPAQRTESV